MRYGHYEEVAALASAHFREAAKRRIFAIRNGIFGELIFVVFDISFRKWTHARWSFVTSRHHPWSDAMKKLIECVPNFSDGRDQNVIRQITDAIETVDGVSLLDVDPGASTNRTVVTFVGDPDAAVEAAFRGIRKGGGIDRHAETERRASANGCD